MRKTKPDLILLGAGGLMGKTFLRFFRPFRRRFGRVDAVDRKPLDEATRALLRRLDAEEITADVAKPRALRRILDRRRGIVVDLTVVLTSKMCRAIFRQGGHSYLNTAFNTPSAHLYGALARWLDGLPKKLKRPHLLFSGMNPGVVNAWAAHGIRTYGTPRAVIVFEYDSSALRSAPTRPLLTWSASHFLAEVVEHPSETVGPRGRIVHHRPSGLFNRLSMRDYLSPFKIRGAVPRGAPTGHEECLTLARRFGVESAFLYAVNPPTMRYLVRRMRAGRPPTPDDLALADNLAQPLIGAEHIGVALEYEDRRVTYFCKLANADVRKASATSFMVIVGVYAGLLALRSGRLAPGAHLVEDLRGTGYLKSVTDNLATEVVVQERRGKVWKTISRRRLRPGKGPTVRLR